MLAETAYSPSRSLPAKLGRRLTQYRYAAPAHLVTDVPLLSVTFDDFPRSAAQYGADALDRVGARGGYYVASGLEGQITPMGEMFRSEDLAILAAAGHEIAAHTHTHLDCAVAKTSDIVADTDRNLDWLAERGVARPVRSFAFPYGETSFDAKKQLSTRFDTLRGILPGINRGRVDRAQLWAIELSDDETGLVRAHRAIEELALNPGWLILFTHDVSPRPSPFGVMPGVLSTLLKHARDAGIRILPPGPAAQISGLV